MCVCVQAIKNVTIFKIILYVLVIPDKEDKTRIKEIKGVRTHIRVSYFDCALVCV